MVKIELVSTCLGVLRPIPAISLSFILIFVNLLVLSLLLIG